jgi:hypothetical protein
VIVQDLTPQAVLHDSGGIVASVDRFTLTYARNGKTVDFNIEPLETYYVRLEANPRWDDGSPITSDEAQQIMAELRATLEHWGVGCEFVLPDDPRILRTIDQVVAAIREQAR